MDSNEHEPNKPIQHADPTLGGKHPKDKPRANAHNRTNGSMLYMAENGPLRALQVCPEHADIIHSFRVLNLTSEKLVVYSGKAR
jgi:hypothetical protein